MSAGRYFLQIPGPTNVPDRVLRAMDRPVPDHRGPELPALVGEVIDGLRQVFHTTRGEIILYPGSGTGAWEASVVNTLSPGDRVLAFNVGHFSHLYADCARRLGIAVEEVDLPWSRGVPADLVYDRLSQDAAHVYRAVLVVHNETSTGVTSKVAAIREAINAARHPALLLVDVVSALGSIDFRFDDWEVDVALTGSQKGLMLPPGLAFISLNERAWALVEQAKTPRFYMDLRLYRKSLADDDTPFTSAVSTVVALGEAVKLILQAGVAQTVARCALMARATRAGAEAIGLSLFAKRPSNGVTAVTVPAGVDGKRLTALMHERSGVMVAGGQGEMAGKLFRFAHMGAISPDDVLAGLAALERALTELGYTLTAGESVRAARAVFGELAEARR